MKYSIHALLALVLCFATAQFSVAKDMNAFTPTKETLVGDWQMNFREVMTKMMEAQIAENSAGMPEDQLAMMRTMIMDTVKNMPETMDMNFKADGTLEMTMPDEKAMFGGDPSKIETATGTYEIVSIEGSEMTVKMVQMKEGGETESETQVFVFDNADNFQPKELKELAKMTDAYFTRQPSE